jgi:hypothetical protein
VWKLSYSIQDGHLPIHGEKCGLGAKAAVLLAIFALACQAQGNQELRNRLSDIAMALSVGNPSNAMEPFDKPFNGYQKLSGYFIALTNACQVASEVEVTDEQDAPDRIKLRVRWTLHLTDAGKNTENRSADLTLQWVRKKASGKSPVLRPWIFSIHSSTSNHRGARIRLRQRSYLSVASSAQ